MGWGELNEWLLTGSGEQAIIEISSLVAESTLRVSPSNIVVSSVTLTEAHVDRCIRQLFSLSGELEGGVAKHLYEEVRDSIHRNWDSRYRWLSQAFDVDLLAGESIAKNFKLVNDLRNSIVHGAGRYTSLQVAKVPKLISMREDFRRVLHVESHGRDLIIGASSARAAIKICRDFIIDFDKAVKSAHPEFDV